MVALENDHIAASEELLAEMEVHKRIHARLVEVLLELGQMGDVPLQKITDYTLENAIGLTESTLGYLAFVNGDETVMTMHSWSRSAMAACQIENKPIEYPIEKTGLWGEALRQRKPIVTNDYNAPNPFKRGYPEGHVKLTRHMNIPLMDGGKIVVVAGVGNKAAEYTDLDVRILTLLMQGMWGIIKRQRVEREREKLQQEIILAQQHALKELATPVIPLFEGILVMPLIGSIDTLRARDIMQVLLAGISRHRAKVVILDITGVPIVDSGVAAHLNRTIQAARLKGARTIITGVSDAVAEAVVDLGIDWSEIETLRDLQTGLLSALGVQGLQLTRS